jgi:hypothetical protein
LSETGAKNADLGELREDDQRWTAKHRAASVAAMRQGGITLGVVAYRLGAFVLCGASAVAIALFWRYFAYASPLADDFLRAVQVRDLPHPRMTQYLEWTGRWTGVGLSYLLSTTIDITRNYGFILLGLAAIYLFACLCFVSLLLDLRFRNPASVVGAIAVYALVLANLPAPGETLYWMTGGIENILPIALGVILLKGLVVASRTSSPKARLSATVGLVLLAVVVTGLHELFAGVLVLVLLVGTIVLTRAGLPERRLWLAALLGAVVGWVVVVTAPGNFGRLSISNAHLPVWRATANATAWFLKYIAQWVTSKSILAASVLLFVWPGLGRPRPPWYETGLRRYRFLVPVLLTLTLWYLFLVPYLLLNSVFPRTIDGAFTVFFLGWMTLVYALSCRWQPMRRVRSTARGLAALFAAVVFCLLLFHSANVRAAWHDLGNARYDREVMRARYDLLRSAAKRGADDVQVPNLMRPVRLFPMDFDVTSDPSGYQGTGLQYYFRVKHIRLAKP